MAEYSARFIKHATSTANVVDTVTITSNPKSVEVINHSSTPLYLTDNNEAPSVKGDNCEVVPGGAALTLPSPERYTIVKIISASAVDYSVAAR